MVYIRKVKSSHPMFQGRAITIYSAGDSHHIHKESIPVPNDTVLCNGCNNNIEEGYLVYLDKRELKANHPYDIYCESCLKSHFPIRTEVDAN